MVVEDEKIVAADIRQNLTMLGYMVPAVLASGEEAIKKAAEQCPDLILMDIQLKGKIDGIEAARIVQSRLNVPVVFITAFADEATIQRAKGTEPYGYLIKPFGKKELQSTIEIALYKYGRERRLKTNEQWLMSVFRCIGEAVVAVDRAGSVCIMNSEAETTTGCALEDSLGAHWQDLWQFLDPKTCGGAKDPIAVAIEEMRSFDLVNCPVRFAKTGKKIVIGSIAPIRDSSGRVSGAVIAFHDVTSQQTLETEYQRVRHLESLQRLAGGIAHNLTGVVSIVSGYAEALLQSMERSDPHFRDVKMIEKAGDHAALLARQLHSFSRRQQAQPQRLDVNRQISNMDPILKHSVGDHIKIELKLEPRLAAIDADPSHLEQIIMSLVLNARDAMPASGTLTLRTANIHLSNARSSKFVDVPPGEYVVLEFGDSGSGIEYEHQGQIFEPFFTTKEREKGAGIGLSVVYGLVKQAGGHIWFESVPGEGTTFSLYFPASSSELVPAIRAKSGNGRGGTETVLVVDDDVASRAFACEALQHLGYRVLQAASGQEALQICEQHVHEIDLVLTDVMLPSMTGLDLANRLTNLQRGLKVLFTSSYSPYALKHHGAIEASTPLLQKPFTLGALAAGVRETLEVHR